jgi:HAD superfamily hydrolase (TIGR01549 family)
MKLKGIIFDIDGTLTSTNELIFSSFNHITQKYLGKTFSSDEIVGLFGPTEDQILEEMCGENFEQAKKEYYGYYDSNHHMADLYPGINDLLFHLKKKNILLSIYTGKGRKAAVITLKKLEIHDYFDLIITGDDVVEHKPSAEGIFKFIDKFKLDKNEVLMIGDSPADVKAAKAAGVKIASVLWDSYAKEKVLQLKSDFVFHSVEELKSFLEKNI